MIRTFCLSVLLLHLTSWTLAEQMTLEQARQRVPRRELPTFWVCDADQLAARLQKLERGTASTLATSPGNRPVHLVTYGAREQVRNEANFNAAIAAREPAAYMDKLARQKPVVLLLGPVHGQETEGLISLVNLVEVLESGRDLRGREWPELRRAADACRLLIVPAANPDGLARFEPRSSWRMTTAESEFWGMGTWSDNTIADWPKSKVPHPHVGPKIGFRGCYFNDAGVNPMHDEFFVPMSTEAPAVLRLARQEGPDLTVSLHSHASNPALLRPSYVPTQVQAEVAALAEKCYSALKERNLPHGAPFKASAEDKIPPDPFNLVSAIYHVSGATAFTFESPRGVTDAKACHVDPDQILDIHLLLFQTMLQHALDSKAQVKQ